MAIATEFTDLVQEYVDSGHPLLWVRTHEEDRALAGLQRVALEAGHVWQWTTPAAGLRRLDGGATVKTEGAGAAVAAVAAQEGGGLFALCDFHSYLKLPAVARAVRDLIPALKRSGKVIVFVSPVLDVPVELDRDVVAVPFAAPGREALRAVLERTLDSAEKAPESPGRPEVEDEDALLDEARGMTVAEAENTFSLALIRHGAFGAAARATIREEKAEAVRRSGLLEWVTPSVTVDDVGDLGRAKAYLRSIAPVFWDPRGAEAFGLLPEDFPRSIAFVGMPGCGKSLLAEAVASLLKVGCVRTDFGRIFSEGGGRSGAAEGNMLRRNQLVESMDPIVDWWDEAEKGLAGAGGQSTQNPWEARVGGSLLTWTEAHRARILTVPTINRHEILPPEMLSRFQKVFFVGFPKDAGRAEIIAIHAAKRRIDLDAVRGRAGGDLVDVTRGLNGREIRNMIQMGMQRAFAAKAAIDFDLLAAVRRGITPLSESRKSDLAAIQRWADENNVEDASGPDAPAVDAAAPRRLNIKTGGKR